MSDLPRFAFVGPVNPGKTSIIATLLEEDDLRISPVPGETTDCQRFELAGPAGEPLVFFYDTPGFQNSRSALLDLRQLGAGRGDPLDAFRKFIVKFRDSPEYADECKLFQPIIDGAGVIYVTDASKRLLAIHRDEMEILRLTGQPVLGLVNWTAEPLHRQDWQNALRLHFRTREFNAHRASYPERVALLKTLIGLEQRWEPALTRAVAAFENDWRRRNQDCAAIIAEMLEACVEHQTAVRGSDEDARQELVRKYRESINEIERPAHERIMRVFRHRRLRAGTGALAFEHDVFDQKWDVLGLDRRQLTITGGVAGGAAGATVDAMLLGHALLLPTVLGSAVGAAAAYFGGESLTRVRAPFGKKIARLLGRETLGGTLTTLGPNAAANFPWKLLDRALLVHACVVRRAHAHTETLTIHPDQLEQEPEIAGSLSKNWDPKTHQECEKIFAPIRKGKRSQPADREKLISILASRLGDL